MMGLPGKWDTCSRTIPVGQIAYLACWGDIIAVQSTSHCILLLDAITGMRKSVFAGHMGNVRSLAFSQDGTLLVSGSEDQTVKLWDIQTGGLIKPLSYTEWIYSVAISPDNATIVSGGYDGTVYIWDVQTVKSHSVRIHKDRVLAIRFSPANPQQVISSSYDGAVQQWNLNGHQVETSHHEACKVQDVDYAPDGACFVSCGEFVATVRDSKSGTVIAELNAPISEFNCCCFSPNGRFVACGGAGHAIYIWDITGSEACLVEKLVGHSTIICSIAFSSSSSLISGSADGFVKIWQSSNFLTDLTTIDNMPVSPVSAPIRSVNVSARDGIIVTSDSSGVVKLWDLTTGACKSSFSTPAQGIRDIYVAGDTLIIVWQEPGWEEKYHVWDVRNSQSLQTVDSVLYQIQDLWISGDGSKMFGLSCNNEIEARSLQTGEDLFHAGVGVYTVGKGGLVVHGSKVWLESSTDMGWDFGGQEVSKLSPSERFSDKPHLCLISHSISGRNKLDWVQNTRTGRLVFCLPERYIASNIKRRLDGQHLSVISPSGELIVVDFSSVCTE